MTRARVAVCLLPALLAARADAELAPTFPPAPAFLDESFAVFEHGPSARAPVPPGALAVVRLSDAGSGEAPAPLADLGGPLEFRPGIPAASWPRLDRAPLPITAGPAPIECAVLIQTSLAPAPRPIDRPAPGLHTGEASRRLDPATSGLSFAGITAAGAIIGLALRKLPR